MDILNLEVAQESCAALFAAGGVKALATIPGIGKSIAEKIGAAKHRFDIGRLRPIRRLHDMHSGAQRSLRIAPPGPAPKIP